MRALCVSIHDVAPATLDACVHITDALRRIDGTLPLTLLVVPRYHGNTSVPRIYSEWIETRLTRGDELALHGLTHRDETPAPTGLSDRVRRRLYTAGEGEFADLTRNEAAERIGRGRAWFVQRGWPLQGFVAPAWLLSPGTWDALNDFDFVYTTTLSRFHILKAGIVLRAPTVVYSTRSSMRRWLSRGWNAALSQATHRMPLVRVGFHAADAAHPEIMTQALKLVERLARDRRGLTKGEFARQCSATHDLRSLRAQNMQPPSCRA